GAAPDGGPVRRGRGRRREAGRREQAADDAPAGAVPPVRQVVEPGGGDIVLELLDPEYLRGRPGRRRACGAVAKPRLERARDRHRRGAGEAGDEALADARGERVQALHEGTSRGSGARRRSSASRLASSRSSRWSPTRSALAMAVSAGLTALDDGK